MRYALSFLRDVLKYTILVIVVQFMKCDACAIEGRLGPSVTYKLHSVMYGGRLLLDKTGAAIGVYVCLENLLEHERATFVQGGFAGPLSVRVRHKRFKLPLTGRNAGVRLSGEGQVDKSLVIPPGKMAIYFLALSDSLVESLPEARIEECEISVTLWLFPKEKSDWEPPFRKLVFRHTVLSRESVSIKASEQELREALGSRGFRADERAP